MIEKVCPCLNCIVDLFNKYFSDKSDRVRISQTDLTPLDLPHNHVMNEEIPRKKSVQILPPVLVQKEIEAQPILASIQQDNDLLTSVNEMRVTQLGEISLNIPQYGTNYHLLKQKVHNAAELLNVNNAVQLKINQKQMKQNAFNRSKVQIWRNHNNSYIFDYEFPCSYEMYTKFMNRQILPEHKNRYIRQYRVLDTIQSNLSLRYLCFEKIGMLESRSFTYLKYLQSSMTDPEGFWEVCVSKDSEQEVVKPISSVATRTGKLFSVSYIKQQHRSEEGMTYIKVRTYISLDINAGIEKVWEKILIETRTYLQELWEQLDNFVNQLQ